MALATLLGAKVECVPDVLPRLEAVTGKKLKSTCVERISERAVASSMEGSSRTTKRIKLILSNATCMTHELHRLPLISKDSEKAPEPYFTDVLFSSVDRSPLVAHACSAGPKSPRCERLAGGAPAWFRCARRPCLRVLAELLAERPLIMPSTTRSRWGCTSGTKTHLLRSPGNLKHIVLVLVVVFLLISVMVHRLPLFL